MKNAEAMVIHLVYVEAFQYALLAIFIIFKVYTQKKDINQKRFLISP